MSRFEPDHFDPPQRDHFDPPGLDAKSFAIFSFLLVPLAGLAALGSNYIWHRQRRWVEPTAELPDATVVSL